MSEALYSILKHPQFSRDNVWWEEFFDPDDLILKEGDASRDLYLIVSGTVRVNMQVKVDDDRIMQPVLRHYFLLHAELLRSLNIKVSGLYAAELRNVATD